jgi:hypothetical protein
LSAAELVAAFATMSHEPIAKAKPILLTRMKHLRLQCRVDQRDE